MRFWDGALRPCDGGLLLGEFMCGVGFVKFDDSDGVHGACRSTPGYKNTPEFGLLIRDRQLSIERKNALIALTEKSTSLDVIKTQTIEHISWFHHNGLPQVVQMERQVFQYSNRPKVMIKDIEELRIRKMELIEQGII